MSRHRRAPSALPVLGYDDLFDPSSDLTSTVPLQPSHPTKDPSILKQSLKPFPNGKFSYNIPNPNSSEHTKLDQSSNESSFKSSIRQEICEKIEILSDIEPENPLEELNQAIHTILKNRKIKLSKENALRRSVKRQLELGVRGELSDDTDRRKDNNKCSEDTVEGPGSSFNMDDFSLVKFDASVEHVDRRRGRVVKFRES